MELLSCFGVLVLGYIILKFLVGCYQEGDAIQKSKKFDPDIGLNFYDYADAELNAKQRANRYHRDYRIVQFEDGTFSVYPKIPESQLTVSNREALSKLCTITIRPEDPGLNLSGKS